MAVEIIEYFDSDNKDNWIRQIERGSWEAAKYLGRLLRENTLRDLCGPSTRLFMITENEKLYSFCTLAEQDEINAPEMSPWIGFIFTFPDYRGKHYMTMLVNYVCDVARSCGAREVFSSPPYDAAELYEKLGFTMFDYSMTTIYGYETSVFCKKL